MDCSHIIQFVSLRIRIIGTIREENLQKPLERDEKKWASNLSEIINEKNKIAENVIKHYNSKK